MQKARDPGGPPSQSSDHLTARHQGRRGAAGCVLCLVHPKSMSLLKAALKGASNHATAAAEQHRIAEALRADRTAPVPVRNRSALLRETPTPKGDSAPTELPGLPQVAFACPVRSLACSQYTQYPEGAVFLF